MVVGIEVINRLESWWREEGLEVENLQCTDEEDGAQSELSFI